MAIERIRWGMVGGGIGAFIGPVHRMAARLDGQFELMAAAPSSDPDRALRSTAELGVSSDRIYSSFEDMALLERQRPDGIEAVSIVAPNHLHFAMAKSFCEAGIHVICDKPLTATLREALALEALVQANPVLFFVTYNYAGYPMVHQARALIGSGELGALRVIQVEYPQGWLATALEHAGSPQAAWRTDPNRAGSGGSIGDIGTHALQLARFVTDLPVTAVAAELTRFVPGRTLDDNASVQLRFEGGARGALWVSQVAVGEDNGLRLRVYGERGGLSWSQERPDELRFAPLHHPVELLRRGGSELASEAALLTRLPAGHPEGFLEAFANLYGAYADAIRAARRGERAASWAPTLADGVEGMRFVDAVVRSSEGGGVWTQLL
jgi:predicted dehydrogenase